MRPPSLGSGTSLTCPRSLSKHVHPVAPVALAKEDRPTTVRLGNGISLTSRRDLRNSRARLQARSLFATLEQPRRVHPLRPLREWRRRLPPAQRPDLSKGRRVGAQ